MADATTAKPALGLPDHTQLPDRDGVPVENSLESPQGELLTQGIRSVLQKLHPDGQYFIGRDCGIYYWHTTPPLRGCKSPDWYYVPGVPPTLPGSAFRRSYVMWQEHEPPMLVIEYVSGDGSEERDRTPHEGKFWVYERGIRAWFYAIYEVDPGRVELYELRPAGYRPVRPNQRGHLPIEPMGVELGILPGTYQGLTAPWLRFFDEHGNLLPSDAERAEAERSRRLQAEAEAEQERRAKESALAELERMRAKFREMGIDPNGG
jgi:Uma2 family endonuclease